MKLLIVEDESKVAAFIKKGLELNGYQADIAADGDSGLKRALNHFYDAIILDLNLPGKNGLEICQLIRKENSKTPILILTASGTTNDKVTGLETGADDYLVKPFEFAELLARIRVILKRATNHATTDSQLKVADLELDIETKVVKRAGKQITLTVKEFQLLEYMIRNKNKVLSRADIAEKIWDITFDTGTNIIDLYIFYLRKKVDKDNPVKLIHTQVGFGYVLKDPEA